MNEAGHHNKILIVEDHPEVRKLLLFALQEQDREFLVADNGEEALSQARREKPDLILLDIMMPGGMNGLEVARILKKDPATASCPIITMTAKIQYPDCNSATESCADDCVTKPFDLAELRRKILRFLRPF